MGMDDSMILKHNITKKIDLVLSLKDNQTVPLH